MVNVFKRWKIASIESIIIISFLGLVIIIGYLAHEWPKSSEFPFYKGISIWGSLTADSSLPSWNFYKSWIFFVVSFWVGIWFWIKKRRQWFRDNFYVYFKSIISNLLLILGSALMVLAIFSGNGWYLLQRVAFIGTALAFFVIATYLMKDKL